MNTIKNEQQPDLPDEEEAKAGYKKTKLGWIPEEWEVVRLEELFEFKNGVNADKEKYGNGVKFINVSEVLNQNFITESIIPGSVELVEKIRKLYVVKKGDVLFNRTSETQEEIAFASVYMGDEEVIFGGFVIRGQSKDNRINIEFKKYCFQNAEVRKQKIARAQGAVRANIGQGDLGKVSLPLPPLPEQRTIATILSTWDKAIDLTQQLLAAKEEQKKGLMQRLLTGRVRVKGFSGEWKEVKLGDIFKERKERGFDNLELLSIGADGVYPQSESNKKDNSNSDKSKYKRICPGDIGYNTMRMWQGRSAISSIEGIVSPAYTIVTPKKGIDVNFMGSLFQLPKPIHSFWRYSQGLVGDTLNCKFPSFALVKVKIPPTYEEQVAIGKILKTADYEIEILIKKLDELQEQKKGLMQQLLTGKVRVKTD